MKIIVLAYVVLLLAYFFQPVGNMLTMIGGGAMFIISDLYIFFLFSVFTLFALYRIGKPNRQKAKGILGEQKVIDEISKLPVADYHLINDVTLPLAIRGTTQIDHILVSKFGVFVIETKNYSGVIHGNSKDKTWTQVVNGHRYKMLNPLYQNVTHVKKVVSLLKCEPLDVHSLVVFVGSAQLKNPMPSKIMQLKDLLRYVYHFKNEVFTEEQVNTFVMCIEKARLKQGLDTDRLHLKFLKSKRDTSRSKNKSGLTL